MQLVNDECQMLNDECQMSNDEWIHIILSAQD
jgi:hypothetical protein